MDGVVTASGAVLLDRDAEVQQLDAALRDAAGGAGRCVAVVGPAGIGKTELLQAARTLAPQLGMTCLAARGGELEREFPYGVARQLFEAPLRGWAPSARNVLFDGAAALSAGALGFDEGTRPADSAFSVVHGLYWLCAGLSETGALLLVVDDLHWADDSSLQFLAYLVRRIGDLPVAVVVATRPPLDESSARLLESIVDDRDTVRLDLDALSDAAVRTVVAPLWEEEPTEAFVDALARATGGNPFLCITAATALSERGLPPDDVTARRLAELAGRDASETVRRRLGRLPEPVAHLARAVAVVGGPAAELRHAATLAGIGPDDAARVRDVLVTQGILAAARGIEFVHPLVRTAIYDSTPPAERTRLHLEAARLLGEEEVAPEQIAVHLLATEPRSEPWVVASLRTAASAVLRQGDSRAAVTFLRRAQREPPPAVDRAEVLHELGVAEFRAGEVDGSALHLAEALEAHTDPRRRVQTGRELGFALFQTGRFADTVDAQTRAFEEAQLVDAGLTGWLEAERHQSALMDPELYRRLGDQLDLQRDVRGDTSGERAFLAARATEGALRVEPGASSVADWSRRALDRGLLDDSVSSSSGIWVNAAMPLTFAGDFATATSVANAMVTDARGRGAPVAAARAHMVRACANLRRGSIVDAEADGRASCELGLEIGFPPSRLAVGVVLEALVERGALDAADLFLREVAADGEIASRFVDNWILYGRARLRIAQGRVDEAIADLIELGRRGEGGWRPWNPGIFGYRSALALAVLRAGDRELAQRLAEDELRLATTWGASFAIGVATRTLGQVVGGDAGLEHLAASVDALARSGARLEHARSLLELGAAIRRAGRPKAAREPLAEGMEIADACGASALTEQALEELRASGARPRRTARSGVNALTAAELRVARLAADGMSNRDIAQALFVTLRTVEVHLTHCYQKLGIASRNELSAALGD